MASGALPHETPVARGGAQIRPVRLNEARSHLTRGLGRGYGGSRGRRRYATRVEGAVSERAPKRVEGHPMGGDWDPSSH